MSTDLHFERSESPAILRDPATGEMAARVEYRLGEDERIHLDYLWVDPERRGQGLARRMLDAFVDSVRVEGRRITPHCGVARKMLTGDDRYTDIL